MKGASDDEPGPTFLVLDCGDAAAAKEAGEHPTVGCCLLGKHRCAAVFHATASDVQIHPAYDVCTWRSPSDALSRRWAETCAIEHGDGRACTHPNPRQHLPTHVNCVVANEVGFRAGARTLARLECVCGMAFPTPLAHHFPYKPPATPPKMPPFPHPRRVDGSLCARVRLRTASVDENEERGFGARGSSRGIAEVDQTTERPEELDIEAVRDETRRLMRDASIARLRARGSTGTRRRRISRSCCFWAPGSAEPSRYRGSSAILIKRAARSTDEGNVLLDAGEGCAGAMKRYLGHDEAQWGVRDLKVLWVSHQHPDHMLGVRGVLALRRPQTRFGAKPRRGSHDRRPPFVEGMARGIAQSSGVG